VSYQGFASREDLSLGELGAELVRPVYLRAYASWEHEVEHHDPVTDIFLLGLVLASLAIVSTSRIAITWRASSGRAAISRD
jgi:hypothetical protein